MSESPLIRRFLSEVTVTNDGCWMWAGRRTEDGYGLFRLAGRWLIAHTVAYELWIGSVPEGLVLDHQCDTRACANPVHLKPVTQQENILRGNGLAAQNARKTHCPAGHPYDEANTLVYDGRRFCRACSTERARRARRLAGVSARVLREHVKEAF